MKEGKCMSKEMINLYKNIEDACDYIDNQAKTSIKFIDFLEITRDSMQAAVSGFSYYKYLEGILKIDFCIDQKNSQRLNVGIHVMSEDRKSLYLEKYKCEIGGARWQIIRRTPLTDALFITLVMDDDSIWRSNYDYWERLKAYRVELSN